MNIRLDDETVMTLRQYADGQLNVTDLARWLASAEYDEQLPIQERDELARISLMVLEAQENLRPADEIMENVTQLLSRAGAVDPARRS